jgi:hypothetical protein
MADEVDHRDQPGPETGENDAATRQQLQQEMNAATQRARAPIKDPEPFDPYKAVGLTRPKSPGGEPDPEAKPLPLDPSDPDYGWVDPEFGGRGMKPGFLRDASMVAAQAGRGLVRGPVIDTAYGLGQLARMATQAIADRSRAAAQETRPQDELAAKWGSASRAMRARERQREPGWLTDLANYVEEGAGPQSKLAKVYGAESAGPVEAATRFAGGLALPFGKAKWAAEGAKGLGKLVATGTGYGLVQPSEHGTFREKAAQAAAGAAGAWGLGKVAQRFAPKAVEKITEAEAKSGISNINAKISAQEGQAADKDVIVPHLKGLANRIGVTIEGNDAAKQKLAAAMTVINNHFAKSPKLGGTPFSNLINDLDIISGDLRQQGGKLSPEMRTVAEGIEKMTAALENHVAQKAPQADKAAQSSARQRLRDFIEGTGRKAEKAEGPLGTSVADLAKAAVFHKWHAASMLPGAGRGLGRLAGSERFRAIAPRLGQAAAVRATQKGEADSDSQN